MNMLLATLEMATARILFEYKTTINKCAEGAKTMVELAKDDGYEVVLQRGYYTGVEHNWTMDPTTGDIYDPTLSQFLPHESGYVPVDSPLYARYEALTDEDLGLMQFVGSSERLFVWMAIKEHRTPTMEDHEDSFGDNCPICDPEQYLPWIEEA